MTVVAWDGTTLAADRMASSNGHKYQVTKIGRIGDSLYGYCGHAARSREVVRWIEAGCDPATWRPATGDEWSTVMVVQADGRVVVYENAPFPIVVEQPSHSIGAGRDFAAAAMFLGHDAMRAVEVASALSDSCGLGVNTLTLSDIA